MRQRPAGTVDNNLNLLKAVELALNGGYDLLDAAMLRAAQREPQDYRHLLVRITGYKTYFTSIGKELQDEIIARESHSIG